MVRPGTQRKASMTAKLRTGIAHIDIVRTVNDLIDQVEELKEFCYAVADEPAEAPKKATARKAPAKKAEDASEADKGE
ncbi:hypothetical protein FDH96_gp150 [Mycobacterium phage Rey]|uniref:Uncharacterized protein n=1 Tax=Mycobacterium phage Rey TaxID=1034115 RepID=G1D5G9_9CAUD|nr:hypothetical protein FDH96_gp150 [Mycobacterium phage Rey]AEK10017.1 hypothetical protein PBI_REY_117 [Mycobacterium phage Rey]